MLFQVCTPLASSSCFLNYLSTIRFVYFLLLYVTVKMWNKSDLWGKNISQHSIDEIWWFCFHMNVLNVTKMFRLNQQLKSVAHLPWKAFMYKVRPHSPTDEPQSRNSLLLIFIFRQAFNTFIDDVFAFIITMPTSHRLACFRDDVVFLIYLYQRWYTHRRHTLTKNTQRYLLTLSAPSL